MPLLREVLVKDGLKVYLAILLTILGHLFLTLSRRMPINFLFDAPEA
jgi:hypothetical protein